MSLAEEIRGRLEPLQPLQLRIHDDSAAHAGHAGARESGGGHFELLIVSEHFVGLGRVARHRLVYDRLADLMPHRIHALAVVARAPDEAAAGVPAG